MIASSPPTWGPQAFAASPSVGRSPSARAPTPPQHSVSSKSLSALSPPSVLNAGAVVSPDIGQFVHKSGSLSNAMAASRPPSAPISIPRTGSTGFKVKGSVEDRSGSAFRVGRSPASRGSAFRSGSVPTYGFSASPKQSPPVACSAAASPKFGLLSKQFSVEAPEGLVAVRPLPPSPPKDTVPIASPRALTATSSPDTERRICESALEVMTMEVDPMLVTLLADAQEYHDIFNSKLVRKAFHLAASAHSGQTRRNGEATIVHCVETAKILASCGLDEQAVAAGLLHDTIDDTMMTTDMLRKMLQDDMVVDLVRDVGRVGSISRLVRHGGIEDVAHEQVRTMLMSMGDYRVVLIKLADRVHNMRTLGGLSVEKQQRFARETLKIFAPLANRLGSWRLKSELEDLCFKSLHGEEYERLADNLRSQREVSAIEEAMSILSQGLTDDSVAFEELTGRPKNLYSIFMKMKAKGYGVDDIHDVRAIRIIVPDEASCYGALKAVHHQWGKVEGKFKDYIKSPKANGYQSLHTVVRDHNGDALEVQIRTSSMHYVAEHGVAAHWRYKERDSGGSEAREALVSWYRWLLSWEAEMVDSKLKVKGTHATQAPACQLFQEHQPTCHHFHDASVDEAAAAPSMEEVAGALHRPVEAADEPEIIIIARGGEMAMETLPSGSTAGDFLHEEARRARTDASRIRIFVNAHPEDDLGHQLRMGDVVEIVHDFDSGYASEGDFEDGWSPANFERSKLNKLWDMDDSALVPV